MSSHRNSVILVAEDNTDWSSTISDFLCAKGYQVVVAHDGIEALDKAQLSNPSLILMDIDMPRMTGLEATRHIRALPAFSRTPIVALSAMADTSDREACLRAGATRYLPKPYSLNGLAEIVASELAAAS